MPKYQPKKIKSSIKKRLRKPKRRSKSLLILECDHEKLKSQSLTMANEIEGVVKAGILYFSKVAVVVVKTTTENNLKSQFANLVAKQAHFDIVAVIGHSNVQGLRLTSDRDVSWTVFAKWIEPFQPGKLVFMACQSGEWSAARELFDGLPSLKIIYAPPLNTTKSQSEIVKALIPYLIWAKSPDDRIISAGQLLNFWLTKGISFQWKRAEFKSKN